MKLTREILDELNNQLSEVLEPLRKAKDEAYEAYIKENRRLTEEKLMPKVEEWYDQELIDKNGQTIKIGDTISSKNKIYRVMKRNSQYVFGIFIGTPRLVCHRVLPNGLFAKKETFFYASECPETEKIDLQLNN